MDVTEIQKINLNGISILQCQFFHPEEVDPREKKSLISNQQVLETNSYDTDEKNRKNTKTFF